MQHCMDVLRLLPDRSWLTSSFLSKVYLSDFRPVFTVRTRFRVDASLGEGAEWEKGERGACVCVTNFW